MCEPFNDDLMPFSMDDLKAPDKEEAKPDVFENMPKGIIVPKTSLSRILPKNVYDDSYVNSILSLRHNKYLRLRWKRFLETEPAEPVRVYLYSELLDRIRKMERQHFVGMKLNGDFYDVDNKLAPVPYEYMPNPRQYSQETISKSHCKRRH